jgi:hypothetical protein
MKTPLTGGHQCGAVRYTVTEPLFTYACHSSNCQKRTGSAFSTGLMVPARALTIEGALTAWSRTSDQGNTNTRYSCAGCGKIIYGIGESHPELAKLQAGTLDDTRAVRPDVHLWTRSKQQWVTLPADTPRFETQPGDALALLQAARTHRAGE